MLIKILKLRMSKNERIKETLLSFLPCTYKINVREFIEYKITHNHK